jgi:hypothetical protein
MVFLGVVLRVLVGDAIVAHHRLIVGGVPRHGWHRLVLLRLDVSIDVERACA